MFRAVVAKCRLCAWTNNLQFPRFLHVHFRTSSEKWRTSYWCAPIGIGAPSKTFSRCIASDATSTGLFVQSELATPDGFKTASQEAIKTCSKLVQEITDTTNTPGVGIVTKMDELSDTLCRIADLAECIRNLHPNQEFARKAQEACVVLNNYVEELNTNVELHRALKALMESKEFKWFDEVTQRSVESLMHDFEISGIHLEASARKDVVRLNSEELELGHLFMQNAATPTLVEKDQCPDLLLNHFHSESGYLQIDHVPLSSADSRLRGLSYLLYYGTNSTQQETLEKLLTVRHTLAELVGYPTFAHRVLKTSMAGDPDTVMDFLEKLSERFLPLAREETEEMLRLKQSVGDQVNPVAVNPWDVVYTTALAQEKAFPGGLAGVEKYFPIEACMDGLNQLFQSLFGVRIETVPVRNGETWHPTVKKMVFISESDELLGYTYCDLQARAGKLASDCHFTIHGGRELSDGSYQTPVITLCCSFSPGNPCLLPQHSVENLFHEMGHALHSMLGRSKYQNVTGTRCSTDFAEVPSILMEYFLADSRVLSSFARHFESHEVLPEHLLRGFQGSNNYFPGFDTQMQILYSIMDQRFHGHHPLEESTVNTFANLHKRYSPLHYVYIQDTASFLRLNHLCGYAAKYYSYLWARAVAGIIWNTCFKEDPFSREVGQRYHEMLKHGGGINPRYVRPLH